MRQGSHKFTDIVAGLAIGISLVLISIVLSCTRAPLIAGYRSAVIKPDTLEIELLQPISAQFDATGRALPVLGSYYTYFGLGIRNTIVTYEHYGQDALDHRRVRYSHVEADDQHYIYKFEKNQELLRGAFGTVYTEKTCYFHPRSTEHNYLWVNLYANGFEHEPPQVWEKPPSDNGKLTHVSLIRVFQRPPGYVVVSAVYSAVGKLRHLWINGSKDGDWVHPSQFPEFSDGFLIYSGNQKQRSVLARFGFPDAVDVASYLKDAKPPFAPSQPDLQLSAVDLHYDYGRWVRQDQFVAGGPHTTRYLTYVQTYEDSVLDSDCAKGFVTTQ